MREGKQNQGFQDDELRDRESDVEEGIGVDEGDVRSGRREKTIRVFKERTME